MMYILSLAGWSQDHNLVRDIPFIIILVLIFAFTISLSYQVKRERTNRLRVEKLLDELETSHRQLKTYAEQVAEMATIEERNRLARDIHDSLGHYLTAISIQLDKALAFRERDPKEAELSVSNAKRLAGEALQDTRSSVSALRSTPQPFSLVEKLDNLLQYMCTERFAIELKIEGNEAGFSRQSLTTLYRAVQEGLTNIQKHAQATQATMRLTFGTQQADLLISDNGIGFNPDHLDLNGQHYGLRGVRERLEPIRGSFKLDSSPGKGTILFISVPRNPLELDDNRINALERNDD